MRKNFLFLSKSYFQFVFGVSVLSYLVIMMLFIYFIGEYPLKYIMKNKYRASIQTTEGYTLLSSPLISPTKATSENSPLSIGAQSIVKSVRSRQKNLKSSSSDHLKVTHHTNYRPLFTTSFEEKFQLLDEKTLIYSGYWDERYAYSKSTHYIRVLTLLKSDYDFNLEKLKSIRFASFFRANGGTKIYNTDGSTYVCSFLLPSNGPQPYLSPPKPDYFSLGELYETCENHRMEWGTFYLSCPVPDKYLTSLQVSNLEWPIRSINVSVYNLKAPHRYVNLSIVIPSALGTYMDKREAYEKWTGYHNLTISNASSAAICVPPLFGNITVHAIVQFMEMSKLLGSSMVYFYVTTNDTQTYAYLKALRHYEKRGEATLLPWFLPIPKPLNQVWNYGQSLSVGDCLYRNMYAYDLLAFNDIDEFLVPRQRETWQQMAQSAAWPLSVSGLKARGAFFEIPINELELNYLVTVYYNNSNLVKSKLKNTPSINLKDNDDIPQNNVMTMVRRTSQISRVRSKCLVKPLLIFEQGIHHVSKQSVEAIPPAEAPVNQLILHHYRKCNRGYDMNCREYTIDYTLRRYADRFAQSYSQISRRINLIP